MRVLALAALAALTAAPASARAQDRPNEQDMFGGGSPDAGAPAAPAPPPGPPKGAAPEHGQPVEASPATSTAPPASSTDEGSPEPGSADRDSSVLGGAAPPHLSDYIAPDNPLAIGGQLYLRSQSSATQSDDAWTLTSPSLLDLYLDARPNPRVRAFILGRMSFDPTAPPGSATTNQVQNGSNGAFVGTSATGFTTFSNQRGPTSLLDQMWLRFDVLNTVFITAGKQHVRWGTGRFWQPTDYLHPIKRNPLDVFDARPGETMVKLHVPWEARGWNFYGFAVTEDPNQATDQLKKVAWGARAEMIILGAEVGVDGLFKEGQKPRLGVDLSTGIWELDVYADVGIRSGQDFQVVSRVANPQAGVPCDPTFQSDPLHPVPPGATVNDLSAQYVLGPLSGVKTQAVGGINWSHKYNDNDLFTIGAEYFYNQPGYADTSLYPGLLFNNSHTPQLNFFYTGRQYAALFASFPQPYSWNLSTFTLSTLTNISDQSYITRVDYSYTLLTHITLEAFFGVHYGSTGGEFRLGFNVPTQYTTTAAPAPPSLAGEPPAAVPCATIPSFTRSPALLDMGVALRIKI